MNVAPGDTVALIGLMGSGKTAVGALLAGMCRRPFIDTDREIEVAAGMSIAEIFEKSGEKEFRRIEEEVIRESAMRKGAVIACGGGAVQSDAAMSALAGSGAIVFLAIDPATAAERLGSGEGRPLLQGADIRAELELISLKRSPRCERLADLTVNAARPAKQVAEDIARELGL